MIDYILLGYLAIGLIWFIAVLAIATIKDIQLYQGTPIACIFCWPITLYGHIKTKITGIKSNYDPL